MQKKSIYISLSCRFSIDYGRPNHDTGILYDEFTSNLYPVRLIDDAYLADSLNDFILRPRLRSPLAVIYNGTMDLYIDKSTDGNGTFAEGLKARNLRISYIAKPATVRYASDIGGTNVDCDLPEYLHNDICKHAIDLYRTSMTGSLYANQEAAKINNVKIIVTMLVLMLVFNKDNVNNNIILNN